jgi:Anti-sigma-K factor rskA
VSKPGDVPGQGAPDPHERIEELLAGHTLRAVDGADALEAERLLSEHVPECDRCRQTLAELQEVASDLALAAPAAPPPDLLFSRLHREIRQDRVSRRRPIASWIGTAAAVAVLGLGIWNAVLNSRLSHETDAKARFIEAAGVMTRPGVQTVSFDTGREVAAHMGAAFRPGDAHVALLGTDVPDPEQGDVYVLWLGSHGTFRPVKQFLPEEGLVVLPFLIDLSRYDQILVTEEPGGEAPGQPSGKRRWSATIRIPG